MTAVSDHAPSVLTSTGPTRPQPFVPRPERELQARSTRRTAWLWWLGCHGGAGESTLAALLPNSAAADHHWPMPPDAPPPVVLVARTSVTGLLAARDAITQWAGGRAPSVTLLGLVLSPDAPGRLPRPLRDLAHQVAGGVPHCWHLPWVEAWRTGDQAGPKPTARLFADLARLTDPS